ncbi:MAG: LicD family protein [Clostridia bacterium]|nr:LicD family protein [Clostridia bacterium]
MEFKYMREGLSDEYGFLPLQDKILEIMEYIDSFCRKNDINYCLMGGSALGAKRHKGFIPWDDDLDIFMTPDNYEKFRKAFDEIGDKERFYLQQICLTDGMVKTAKLRMNNTTYIEPLFRDWDIHQGIFIDIFILHNCPNTKIAQLWQCFWAKYVVVKGLASKGYDRRKGAAEIMLRFFACLPKRFLLKFALKQVYRYRGKKTDFFCNFLGKAVFKKGIYKREWFEISKDTEFEKLILKVPSGIEAFLTERFGDYMTPPSPERIKWEQHAEEWDTEKDFQELLNRKCCFRDEEKLI